MDVEKIVAAVLGIDKFLDVDGVSVSQVSPLVKQVYEEAVKKYRPVLQSLPSLSEQLADDLLPLFKAFHELSIRIRSDDELHNLTMEDSALVAKKRQARVKIYEKAGFSREEAIALLLQDTANYQANVARVRDSATNKK